MTPNERKYAAAFERALRSAAALRSAENLPGLTEARKEEIKKEVGWKIAGLRIEK